MNARVNALQKRFCYLILFLVIGLVACSPESSAGSRVKILPNPYFDVRSEPELIAENLNNPSSLRPFGKDLVFAESGEARVNKISLPEGEITALITGFGMDSFAGYDISVLGISVDIERDFWIIAAAEGDGQILIFDPQTFPSDASTGRKIEIVDAVKDNPFATVLAGRGDILVASGGTSKAYQAPFNDPTNPEPLEPIIEVESGIIGVTVDPKSGHVFGAIFGSKPGDGAVGSWDPTAENPTMEIVASGLTNVIDVSFTPESLLLVLEFGGVGEAGGGAVSIVSMDGEVTPFIQGLSNPSGIHVSSENRLYITEFGSEINGGNGTIIAVDLIPASGDYSSSSPLIIPVLLGLLILIVIVIVILRYAKRATES